MNRVMQGVDLSKTLKKQEDKIIVEEDQVINAFNINDESESLESINKVNEIWAESRVTEE